jgi:hypothetical protein
VTEKTMCTSDDCAVRNICRRNSACPVAYPPNPFRQSWALFEPEKGEECRAFSDCREPWESMRIRVDSE